MRKHTLLFFAISFFLATLHPLFPVNTAEGAGYGKIVIKTKDTAGKAVDAPIYIEGFYFGTKQVQYSLPPGNYAVQFGTLTGYKLKKPQSGQTVARVRAKRTATVTAIYEKQKQPGSASGKLAVSPDNVVEQEPNNSIAQAQSVTNSSKVFGDAAYGDAGFILPQFIGTAYAGLQVEDLYLLQAPGPARITLTVAANDLVYNDLDLVLMDSSGTIVDLSEGNTNTERLETTAAGSFLVGVRVSKGSSAYSLSFSSLGSLSTQSADDNIAPIGADFVPGHILMKWKEGRDGIRKKNFSLSSGAALAHERDLPGGVELMRVLPAKKSALQKGRGAGKLNLPGSEKNALKSLTVDAIRQLRNDQDIEYAEPNFIRKPLKTPNDEHYKLQWHYPLINLPQAWETTTGSADVIVAVIDTGILSSHPDLSSKLVSGYDFISDPSIGGDGNGIDSDPTDVGDDYKKSSSSFHGTHVAGTIGAATNNSVGVAGVSWETRIMPLRVLGIGGGTDADIAQAIRYAAGLSNSSGTTPSKRANIINMSLGGAGSSATTKNAIQAARDQGVIIVAAAGNDNVSTLFYPASYDGVVSVSAVDMNSQKSPYSNYGNAIDVAAPGGDSSVDLNNDGYEDGVLSTLGDDSGKLTYRFYQGTSMASPHMAGVVALMMAVNPNLTPTDLDDLLKGTHSKTSLRITRDIGEAGWDNIYGNGLIDASQAVLAAKEIAGGGGTAPPTESILSISNSTLSFENYLSDLSFDISNSGGGTLNITSVSSDASWLSVKTTSGTAPLSVGLGVDRAGLSAGNYSATVTVQSDAAKGSNTAAITVTMSVVSAGGSASGDVGTVYVLFLDAGNLTAITQAVTDSGNEYAFDKSQVPAGTYIIAAGTDRDDDLFICDVEDACGIYPDLVTIAPGQNTADINFDLGELMSPQSQGSGTGQKPHREKFKRLR
ncbi:MAG: S8 family serine peptidase [Nitrospinae bacterium]|nr:S8 family serine peptidase [Nitrospinota bacterium]